MWSSEAILFGGGVGNVVAIVVVALDISLGINATKMDARTNIAEFAICGGGSTPVFLCGRKLLSWGVHLLEGGSLSGVEIGEIGVDEVG